ncbi:hypothetical protein A4A49_51730 [Nicotiana attenuata]|uniref:Uncharacterized protein n=1 Tax=Nicotiana attenuata TaxID=49451 RepID=A0A1J6IIU1_NICAT|nr:hypothetical protein A4A49_51730 [Nicotiana attenuata]
MTVDNNFTESFNSWILEARHKPIIKMLEKIRVKVMEMSANNEGKLRSWNGDFTPKRLRLYNDYRVIAQGCVVVFNGDYGYEIAEELSETPCPHAIKALAHKKVELLTEINWFYSREAYLRTYRHKLLPVRGQKFWKMDLSQHMEPPEVVKLIGRPEAKRNKEPNEARKRKGEWSASRKGLPVTCSKCGELNHNARGCYKGKATVKIKAKAQLVMITKVFLMKIIWMLEHNNHLHLCLTLKLDTTVISYSLEVENEEDPLLRPMVVSETQTWLESRNKNPITPMARDKTRKIQLRGDHIGAANSTNLPYSPINFKKKDKRKESKVWEAKEREHLHNVVMMDGF